MLLCNRHFLHTRQIYNYQAIHSMHFALYFGQVCFREFWQSVESTDTSANLY